MTTPLIPSRGSAKSLETTPERHLTIVRGDAADSPQEAQQIPLALQWQIAPGVPAVRPTQSVGHESHPGPTGMPSHIDVMNDQGEIVSLPHPMVFASTMARMVFEVGCGERPAAQLNKWVSRGRLATLGLRGQSYARHPATRAQKGLSRLRKVRAVRAMQVAPGIFETSAVLVGTARSHAIAMRMEARGSQWLLTAIEMR